MPITEFGVVPKTTLRVDKSLEELIELTESYFTHSYDLYLRKN